MLVAVDLARLGDTVRWEPARGGQLFPHIYGRLPVGAVVSTAILKRTADGTVRLPAWRVAAVPRIDIASAPRDQSPAERRPIRIEPPSVC
jgi:hypothetical protein